jgi:hypothetical protein
MILASAMRAAILSTVVSLAPTGVVMSQDNRVDFVVKEMPFEWATGLQAAMKEFNAIKIRDHSCYMVNMARNGGDLLIEFIPRRTPAEAQVRGGGGECGPAVAYTVDMSGKVLKSTYYR